MKTTKLLGWMLFAFAISFAACTNVNEPNPDPDPDPTEEAGEGTKEKPYTVADIIKLNPTSTTEAVKTAVWTKGFIVGYYNSTPNPAVVEAIAPFTDDVNIMLAASATETDKTKMLSIQLPAGAVRTALGLKTTPANFGKEVLIYGDIMKYNTFPGVKNTAAYWFVAENTGINPPEKGNFDVPVLSIADLVKMHTGSDVDLDGTKKIVGVVTTDLEGGNSTSKKNLVVTSEDNTSGIAIRFSDKDNTYALGDKIEVLLTGKLTVYAKALQLSVAIINTAKIGNATITPREATVEELNTNFKSFEYCVVRTQGLIQAESGKTTFGNSATHQNNTLTNSNSSVVLFVSKYASFINSDIPANTVSVTGVMQVYNDTKQLIVRNMNDVK